MPLRLPLLLVVAVLLGAPPIGRAAGEVESGKEPATARVSPPLSLVSLAPAAPPASPAFDLRTLKQRQRAARKAALSFLFAPLDDLELASGSVASEALRGASLISADEAERLMAARPEIASLPPRPILLTGWRLDLMEREGAERWLAASRAAALRGEAEQAAVPVAAPAGPRVQGSSAPRP